MSVLHPMLNHLCTHTERQLVCDFTSVLTSPFGRDIFLHFFSSGLNLVLPKQSQAVPPQSVDLTFSRETSGRGSMCRAPAHTPARTPGPFTWPSYLEMSKPPSSPAPPWGGEHKPLGQRAKPTAAQMGERVENQTRVPSPPQLRAEGWCQM